MSKMWYLSAALTLLVVSKCEAYKNNFGKCARVDTHPNFDMQQMMGNWYVIVATSTSKRCLTYYLSNKFGHPQTFLLTEIFTPSDTAQFFGNSDDYHRTGVLKVLDRSNPAVMSYKTPEEAQRYKFSVLDTDYNRYALIYVCKNKAFGLRRWSAMLLSRTPWLESEFVTKARSILKNFHIKLDSLSQINHAHCETKSARVPTLQETLDMIFKKNLSKPKVDLRKPFNDTSVVKKPEDSLAQTITPKLKAFDWKNEDKAKMMMNDRPLFIPL